ncbi:hypothetical protein [Paludisphaera soli]|uniref:hypothetical protein n=1 Tax=Paludisphaera soli TaxID=2712865 RepID=UPI0013EBBA39|nr:hypothetical protein [Paludisphaera soli]
MGYLQVQSVEGQNLFTIGRADFDAWVARTIADGDDPQGVLAVFKQARGLDGIPAIAAFLWGNVERMRLGNQPFPGVTGRDYMPQPPSGGVDEMVAWFESGALNSRFPMVPRLG